MSLVPFSKATPEASWAVYGTSMTRTAPKLARARRKIAAVTPNVLRVLPPSAETKESGGGPPWNGYRDMDGNR